MAVFLLMAAYYVIKPVREELILSTPNGAEFKAYAAGASALVLLLFAPVYERLVQRIRRDRLLILVGGFFAMTALGFFWLSRSAMLRPYLGIPFYLWASVLGMMLVAQFWSLASDIHGEAEGRRLFVILGLGQSLGAVSGSKFTAWLLSSNLLGGYLDVSVLLLVSAMLLTLATLVLQYALRAAAANGRPHQASIEAQPLAGFQLLLRHRYVGMLAGLSLVLTLVNSNGEYLLGKMLRVTFDALPAAAQPGFFASFYGDFYFYVNLLSLVVQALLVSRIVRFGGLGRAVMVLPMIAMVGASAVAFLPLLAIMRVAKTLENAVDYSLNNTARNMLWLPTTTDMKYKAKYLVDTFMVRMGDVAAGLLVLVSTSGMQMLGYAPLDVRGFALVNALLCTAWFALGLALSREHAALTGGLLPSRLVLPKKAREATADAGALGWSSTS